MRRPIFAAACLLLATLPAWAQRLPQKEKAQPSPQSELTVDEAFESPISEPAFPVGQGPAIAVDERHHNIVTLASYFGPVGRLLAQDGYVLRPWRQAFQKHTLGDVRIVVIANAQAPPGAPAGTQAFPEQEVHALDKWVKSGGGLLLLADRAPYGGQVRSLARAFGVTPDDNTILARDANGAPTGELTIEVARDGDPTHPIFAGVSRVVYVVGESLSGPGAILKAPAGTYSGASAQATKGSPAAGKPLVLAFPYGEGRVVAIGDAGIASAFGSAGAPHRGISEADNARFVRNVFRWLAKGD